MTAFAELVEASQAYYCLDCGVCTGSCPVAKVFPAFSPRQIVEKLLYDLEEPTDDTIWTCLTCAQCSVRCPAEINFPELIRAIRDEARPAGNLPVETHHSVLQIIPKLQMRAHQQRRTAWAETAGKVSTSGDYFYFVGCLPFFDIVFRYIDVPSLDIARSALKLMNLLGIEPAISENECCCGHDALWTGNETLFRDLAARNLEVIRASGAKTVLFSCPEGYMAFKEFYPRFFGPLPFEVLHLTELLSRELPKAGLAPTPLHNSRITYQDPCRLGRLGQIYDAPRDLIRMVPEVDFIEMPRSRSNGICCGTTGWISCSSRSKQIQVERLTEAVNTGAETLITACPKCHIHFRCTQTAFELNLKVVDLFNFIAQHLSQEEL